MDAEDLRDLQSRTLHAGALRGWHGLQWADDFAQDLGGHVRIHRGGLELLVPEQDLDDADIDLLLEQVRGKTVPFIPISE